MQPILSTHILSDTEMTISEQRSHTITAPLDGLACKHDNTWRFQPSLFKALGVLHSCIITGQYLIHLLAGDRRPRISKLSSKNNFKLTVTLTQKLAGCRQLKNGRMVIFGIQLQTSCSYTHCINKGNVVLSTNSIKAVN
jgi:hypothetical protein